MPDYFLIDMFHTSDHISYFQTLIYDTDKSLKLTRMKNVNIINMHWKYQQLYEEMT